ncbi:hypothetical protein, partial [uncultured Bartonella sp.]|uniref:hypothetical protein n=1 Tax=uncultured Bartonella sp. TaxID=104108 RepID=UPI00262F7A58
MSKLLEPEFLRRFKTLNHKNRKALLLTVGTAALFCPHIAYSEPVLVNGNDKTAWTSDGVSVGGNTTNKLSEVVSNARVPTDLSSSVARLNSAIKTHVTTPDKTNKQNLENAITSYNDAVAALEGSGAAAAGIPSFIVNDTTILIATKNQADQRLVVVDSKSLLINIADRATLVISGNFFNGRGDNPQRDCDSTNTARKGCGGALHVSSGAAFVQNGAGKLIFRANKSADDGGAVFNKGSISFGSGVSFLENSTSTWGGAVNNFSSGTILFGDDASFIRNAKSGRGGAIRNDGMIVFADNAFFDQNASADKGGAIYNTESGKITFGDGTTFTKNNNYNRYNRGGAIYNEGKMTFGKSARFSQNSADSYSGAIYNDRKGQLTFEEGAIFENNVAWNGGAISNYGTIVVGDNAMFNENVSNSHLGGAIFSNSGTITFGNNATFKGNTAYQGGAINLNSDGTIQFGDNATFANNKADYAGAIATFGTTTFGSGATFINNESKVSDTINGVVDNAGTLTLGSGARFINNKSTGNNVLGGAISNRATLILKTDANGQATQFFGNRDSTGLSSIFFEQGSLAVVGDGIVDMLDPMQRINNKD